MLLKRSTSLGGLEPPTFRLTAERANQLRHRDLVGTVWPHLADNISSDLSFPHFSQTSIHSSTMHIQKYSCCCLRLLKAKATRSQDGRAV